MTIAAGSFGPLESAGPALVWIIVLTFVFLECALIIGLFLPGDSLLVTAGIVLATHEAGAQHTWALSAGAMGAAIAGNQVGYAIGKRSGHHLVARRNGKYVNAANLHKVNVLLDRHGFWAVLVARWIPWVRTLCPMVAGAANMDHRRYTIASSIGAVVWAPVLLMIGFYCGSLLERVPWLMPLVLGLLVTLLVIGTAAGVWSYRREMAKPAEDVEVDDVHN
ncbi:DedA family protein [Rhodococcus hoagii]|jgi:membrane-associated protein|nr:DedA family protein [Prescottella equi]MCD7050342.1 DedA family protein [Rhodococcus sp. BH2-1]GBF16318.1 inner membrane protein YqjA [Rhodococcus sp. Br-6]ERN44046.1 membrane-associated protein [Prescottella equi NBRC 101255 = C 7]MBM4472351.1 DedA family protein [Prescottella equi]MBM4474675.1 DedA family protein [Prescottella equi]